MMSVPCFADCVHAKDGECILNVIGCDRLREMECACEFFQMKNSDGTQEF